jgi:hypothetical protein
MGSGRSSCRLDLIPGVNLFFHSRERVLAEDIITFAGTAMSRRENLPVAIQAGIL